MEYEGKKKSLYRGIWIPFVLMVAVPTILYFVFYFAIGTFSTLPHHIVVDVALGFAALVGTLFMISCWIAGFLSGFFSAWFKRIYMLFTNIKIFKGKAIRWYFEDFVRTGGIILWLFFLFLILNILLSLFGFISFFVWYRAN